MCVSQVGAAIKENEHMNTAAELERLRMHVHKVEQAYTNSNTDVAVR